ncbi:DUF1643 domain-containing protein [Agromyces sp. CFH 90414]|uniref:DUF1643 domain-containing protein n=1 Tax=Agromyces agglutinans TaxID=2662258 RepID=A0A6I2F3T0_9MICO|nr:DUF1643 domain-containing protein [Agromyces agglutinans]MRG60125.1 DUF1643 domain-containing protein [Agromyces agglutinans]
MTPTAPLRVVSYPPGLAPNLWSPDPAVIGHRFILGQINRSAPNSRPLVLLGMNPSHANENTSDTTVNRAAEASVTLGHSGWVMLNLYPERATKPKNLRSFDQKISDQNCLAIGAFLKANGISEIFGAWGNPPNSTIRQARSAVLGTVMSLGIRIFYFGDLTTKREPRHLTPRRGQLDLSAAKHYL